VPTESRHPGRCLPSGTVYLLQLPHSRKRFGSIFWLHAELHKVPKVQSRIHRQGDTCCSRSFRPSPIVTAAYACALVQLCIAVDPTDVTPGLRWPQTAAVSRCTAARLLDLQVAVLVAYLPLVDDVPAWHPAIRFSPRSSHQQKD
jgi:hypothetical protein